MSDGSFQYKYSELSCLSLCCVILQLFSRYCCRLTFLQQFLQRHLNSDFLTYCISRSLVKQSEGVTLNILSRYQVSNCQSYSLLNEHYRLYLSNSQVRDLSEGHPATQARPSSTHKNTILMAPAYINISAEIWNAVSQSILCITIIFHQKYLKQ